MWEPKVKIVVVGATGFIGRPLCTELAGSGHSVTTLTRNAERARAALGGDMVHLDWGNNTAQETRDAAPDIRKSKERNERQSEAEESESQQRKALDSISVDRTGAWKEAVRDADAVINLAGESVGGSRWTPEFKQKLMNSRIDTTRALVDVLIAAQNETHERIEKEASPGSAQSRTLINASAVGYYGDRADETLTESSRAGSGFLADLCVRWEAEALRAQKAGVRVVLMRTGIVLGDGGALQSMLHPFPMPFHLPFNPWAIGLGGPMGNGKQWMPWIHLDDTVGLFIWAATNAQVVGACNVTAPNPVTNAGFAHALGAALHRPSVLPVPGCALKLLLGEFAGSLLGGQRAMPAVAERMGYTFEFREIAPALASILKAK